jgi:WhiB family redox-sensing transcriptional regulator
MTIFVFQPEEDYPDFELHGPPPCTEANPEAFFSEDAPEGSMKKARGRYTYEREAKKICGGCEYMHACRAYAMKRPELDGIWGGTTEIDRSKIRRGLRLTPVKASRRHI